MDNARHVNCSYKSSSHMTALIHWDTQCLHFPVLCTRWLNYVCHICSRPCDFWPLRIEQFSYCRTYMHTSLLTYLPTYSMEQSPSWEANWFSANQESPHILWNPKVHYHIISACHLSLSWARSVQSIPPHPTSWRSEHSIEIGLWWNTYEFSLIHSN